MRFICFVFIFMKNKNDEDYCMVHLQVKSKKTKYFPYYCRRKLLLRSALEKTADFRPNIYKIFKHFFLILGMFFRFFSRSWSELTDIRLNRICVNELKLYLVKLLNNLKSRGQVFRLHPLLLLYPSGRPRA